MLTDGSEGKMVLHNSILKFDFEPIMIIDYLEAILKEKLQKNSKILKNLHRVPKKIPRV